MGHYATAAQVWAAALVFSRIGAFVMVMPGVAQGSVPPLIRLSFALVLAMCIGPIAQPYLPVEPATVDGTAFYIGREVLIGLTIGGLLQVFLTSLSAAGEFVSVQTTLAFAQTANPTEASSRHDALDLPDPDGRHADLRHRPAPAVHRGDGAQLHAVSADARAAAERRGRARRRDGQRNRSPLACSLPRRWWSSRSYSTSRPVSIGRMMPQFQIFFVATPLSLLLGLSIFALSLGGIGMVWTRAYEDFLRNFV